MIVLAILMSLISAWSFIDIVSASRLANRKRMSSDFIAVYARLFLISGVAAVALWFGALS